VATELKDLIAKGGPILADGGMGTMLFSLGLGRGTPPELWNVEHPEKVRSIHRQYLDAGARIILTNSFGGNRLRLSHRGLADRVIEMNREAAKVARAEVEAMGASAVVGGSIGPTGSLMAPLGELTEELAKSTFIEQARALVEGGVDVLWVETISSLEEMRAAIEACQVVAEGFPIVATMTFDTHGHTSMGVSPQAALEALSEYGLHAFGANCGNGPEEIESVIEKMHALDPQVVLVAKSNAGMPRLQDGEQVYDASPELMAEHALKVHHLGATIIGACCGSTPDHIRAMGLALRGDTAAA
jgi:methionine synthase I (cobalamin-dependent)